MCQRARDDARGDRARGSTACCSQAQSRPDATCWNAEDLRGIGES